MQLSNQQTLPVTQQQAWEALNDISLLQAAIPGCESITPAGDNQYEVAIMAAVGPVKARFKGKLRLADLVPPTSYAMHFEGQGGAAGHGKGSAQVRLEATGARETVLHYTANASVGGKLAQVGSRLVDMAAQKMANDFFATFNTRLAERYAAPAAAPAAEPTPSPNVWARVAAWFKRLFGG
jgi:carbon monoxide dehydrogenase subunit G